MPTPELTARIGQLKDLLVHGGDFFKMFNYFFDELAANEELARLNKPVTSERIQVLLKQAAMSFLKTEKVKILDLIMLHVRGTPMYHGGFNAQGSIFTFLFFEDVNTGLLAINRLGDAETHILRMTCQVVGEGPLFN